MAPLIMLGGCPRADLECLSLVALMLHTKMLLELITLQHCMTPCDSKILQTLSR
jgi:hypothetical protein